MRSFFRSLAILATVTIVPSATGQPADAGRVDEYRVKAAILYNLTRFVSWPSGAFVSPTAPFVICVLGIDPFGTRLDEVVRGHHVGERAVTTLRIAEVTRGCHVLFLSNSEQRRLPALLAQLKGSGALTVGEIDDFTKSGGMVGLTTDGDQVRFAINVPATTEEGLKVSARLMSLASGAKRAGSPQP